jgi:hypothetical protein
MVFWTVASCGSQEDAAAPPAGTGGTGGTGGDLGNCDCIRQSCRDGVEFHQRSIAPCGKPCPPPDRLVCEFGCDSRGHYCADGGAPGVAGASQGGSGGAGGAVESGGAGGSGSDVGGAGANAGAGGSAGVAGASGNTGAGGA